MIETKALEYLNNIYDKTLKNEIIKYKSKNKNISLSIYLKKLNDISIKAYNLNKEKLLKKFYYKKYILRKENIPKLYYRTYEKNYLQQNYYFRTIEDFYNEKEEQLIKNQKESLDRWIDYLMKSDYPIWFKYFIFQGITRIGNYDINKKKYTKRTKNTVNPFIEINDEAINLIFEEINKYLNEKTIEDKTLFNFINNGNFLKIYSYTINKIRKCKKIDDFNNGIWKIYYKDSNPENLLNDIYSKETGWCIAYTIETVKSYLNKGNIHIYYTKDENNKYTNPRITFYIEKNKIKEIRGISKNQNLEPQLIYIVKNKLNEFENGINYYKTINDLETLTVIYDKWKNNITLSNKELRFLYEIDENISGFGYSKDSRIKEILEKRNKIEDLKQIFNCKYDNISKTKEEALKGNIIWHDGDLDLTDYTELKNIKLPKIINGNLKLNSNNVDLSNLIIKRSLYFSNIQTVENINLSNTIIKDHLFLDNFKNINGLDLTNTTILNCLDLDNLNDIEVLDFSKTNIKGSIRLGSIKHIKQLNISNKIINGFIKLSSLENAQGLNLKNTIIKGNLFLESLKDIKTLNLESTRIEGCLVLNDVENIEELDNINYINKVIYKNSIIKTKSIKNKTSF